MTRYDQRSHAWCAEGDNKRCIRCGMLSAWPGAKDPCTGIRLDENDRTEAHRGKPRARLSQIRQLMRAGRTVDEVADVLGLARWEVRASLKRARCTETKQPHAAPTAGAVTGPEQEARWTRS